MRHIISLSIFIVFVFAMCTGNTLAKTGRSLTYEIEGVQYEGYYTDGG